MSVSDELFAEALKVMPGGVSSPVRAYAVSGARPLRKRALGSHIVDVTTSAMSTWCAAGGR
ncbi:hypothetical protein [Propionibacterium freudenreichii]|uniref:hypothetical protein n=1 Tax=Propionibacterium freudenreichii TaxID=1744 RepID=UPI00254CCBA4|nr:hypothetical protein [Propionibacterium freudenreichii]